MEKLNWSEQIRSMAQCYDPIAHGRSLVESYNASPGNQPHLDCPKCKNRGTIARLRDDGSYFITECSCMKTRNAIARMERSGLKMSIRDLTFDKYEAVSPWQIRLKSGAMEYAKNSVGWFLICGQSGCGKTHLCTAICRELLLQGKDVHYMSWREDISRLKALHSDEEQREKLLNRLKTAEVLYIDDLFKTGSAEGGLSRPTAADINLAFEIINYRYINQLRTIFSTEMQVHELLNVDEATGGRIVELAGAHVYAVKSGRERNYRLRNLVSV